MGKPAVAWLGGLGVVWIPIGSLKMKGVARFISCFIKKIEITTKNWRKRKKNSLLFCHGCFNKLMAVFKKNTSQLSCWCQPLLLQQPGPGNLLEPKLHVLRKSSGCLASARMKPCGLSPFCWGNRRVFLEAKKWVLVAESILKGLIKAYILSVLMSYKIDDMTNTVYIGFFLNTTWLLLSKNGTPNHVQKRENINKINTPAYSGIGGKTVKAPSIYEIWATALRRSWVLELIPVLEEIRRHQRVAGDLT